MNDVQKVEFNVLMEVIKIFKRHNLKYFAIGGTCLGAIRHGGFIPWDDDVDIGMPRIDYELFKNEYYKELPDPYRKQDYNEIACDNFLFIKIYDSRTTQIETYAKDYPDRYTGAFVDIMPIDGWPTKNEESKKIFNKIKRYGKLNNLNRPCYYFKNPRLYKNRIIKIMRMICSNSKIRRYDYYANKIKETLSEYDFSSSEEVIFTWRCISAIPMKRKIYAQDIFANVLEVPFESGSINVPYRYDDYLKQDYDNYMELPPEGERSSGHDVYISDMEKPCNYYANKYKEAKI